MNLTFGAELEFADVRYGQPLPEGSYWNKEDYSIVNSSGIANCPIGKHYPFGGEINTKPTCTTEEQMQVFEGILALLDPKPVVNYRCNLHIHVGMKGLSKNLLLLKFLLRYIERWEGTIYQLIEPIPKPTTEEYPEASAFKGAMKRYRRRFKSHQSKLTTQQVGQMLSASTPQEFYLAHFKTDKAGVPQKQLHQRCGINLRSLWENNETIEFRHFPGTLDPKEFLSCVKWCEAFMVAALETDESPLSLLKQYPYEFPRFEPYIHRLEQGYEKTSHHVPSKQRIENIAAAQA